MRGNLIGCDMPGCQEAAALDAQGQPPGGWAHVMLDVIGSPLVKSDLCPEHAAYVYTVLRPAGLQKSTYRPDESSLTTVARMAKRIND
jgi:hypothetical protein